MLAIVLTLIIGWFVGDFLGYVIHKFFHSPLSGRLYKSHMVHHLELYPTSDFFSRTYRSPGKDSTVISFSLFIAAISILMFFLLPAKIATILTIEFIIIGLINNYIHDIIHIRPNRLTGAKWFERATKLHYRHHKQMDTNFGIFTFGWDKLFKTYHK